MAAVDLQLPGRSACRTRSVRRGLALDRQGSGEGRIDEGKWAEAEIRRVAGEIALRSPVPDIARAVSHFTAALAIARRQQAKSWELRAAISCARLMRDQGRVREAHDLLAPIYGRFEEGFGTKDLKDARTLLEELAP